MSKSPIRRLLLSVVSASLLIGLPILIARAQDTKFKPPQFVGKQAGVEAAFSRGARFLHLSPNEQWLASENDDLSDSVLWDLKSFRRKRKLQGAGTVFSKDSRWIASYDLDGKRIFLGDPSRLRWAKKVALGMVLPIISFSADNKKLRVQIEHESGTRSETHLTVSNGHTITPPKPKQSPWREKILQHKDSNLYMRISYVPPGAKRAKFAFETSNEYDGWQLSPDGKLLWVARNREHRFDVRDAKTGRRLWFYSSNDYGDGQFACEPSWEGGGKMLATLENDTLWLRDGRTGKVLLRYKNPGHAALKSWAFTRDRKTVYLMNAKGQILRQPLS